MGEGKSPKMWHRMWVRLVTLICSQRLECKLALVRPLPPFKVLTSTVLGGLHNTVTAKVQTIGERPMRMPVI